MSGVESRIDQALEVVQRERSQLEGERCAFEEFREAVRLATPENSADADESMATELRDAYQSMVMDALDYRVVYGDTLFESVGNELSPSLAEWFRSEGSMTQRRKRKLLVATSRAIERREAFDEELAQERAALDSFAAELTDIESTVDTLPKCSPRRQSFESLLDHWERYHVQAEHCARLLEQRQRQLADAERTTVLLDDAHAFNEYIYDELDSSYPVLSTIAVICRRIEAKQGLNRYPDRPGLSLES